MGLSQDIRSHLCLHSIKKKYLHILLYIKKENRVREDTHKERDFLVVEPLRSGYLPATPYWFEITFFYIYITWKWSTMDKNSV